MCLNTVPHTMFPSLELQGLNPYLFQTTCLVFRNMSGLRQTSLRALSTVHTVRLLQSWNDA